MTGFTVYPSQPFAAPQAIKLSICDVYSPKVWVAQTHFWPVKNLTDALRSYEVLKEGLSRTLAEIPALAGTAGRLSEDPRDLVVNVDSDAHVEFAWEDLSNNDEIPSYSKLKADGFPLTGLVAPFSQTITLSPVFEGARMMTAKLNHIKGGLALTFAFNHLITDAAALAEVERIWSLHTTDVSNGVKSTHRAAIPDARIRAQLSKPVPEAGEFVDKDWKVFPTASSQLNLPRQAVAKEAALTILEQTKKAHLAAIGNGIQQTKWCMWRFSPESLANLKKEASGADATQWISTMDALIGLFWSRLSHARQSSKEGHKESLVLFPINVRKRVQPPIHPQYIGNAVDIIVTTCPLPDLEDVDNGLSKAAGCIRKAVSGWEESKWAAWLTMAAGLPQDQAICPNPVALLATHNIGFNDYSNSQSNTLTWGSELGVIDRTRYMKPAASLAGCATAVIVHPRLADGGLEVAMTSTDHMKALLEDDPVFSRHAQFVSMYE